jgi:cytochrome c oxidase assembly protein subunit 15
MPMNTPVTRDARAPRTVALWLLACCALVLAMVVVGGVTRLTHSGLSIVEWKPIMGTLPPLNQEQWLDAFAKYQLTPEYLRVNHGMDLSEFKGIFWWEYFHRLLGRMIGLVFIAPLLWFWARRQIDRPLAIKLLGIFVLGGLQGAMGWYMVQSGLVDDPRVSHLRLTAHLGLALLIFAAMQWVALDLRYAHRTPALPATRGMRWHAAGLTLLIFVMSLSGGLVAGIRAGSAYNTFPLMNGNVVPPEIFMIEPWYLNFFNNMATVQFDHRLIGWLLAFLTPWLWWRMRTQVTDTRVRCAADLLLAMLVIQIALGIATLLLFVPIPLAAAHQGGAVLLLAAVINATHALGREATDSAPA